jgi:hypothetical protein
MTATARIGTKVHVNTSQTDPETASCMVTNPPENYKVCEDCIYIYKVDETNVSFQTALRRSEPFQSRSAV